VGFFLFSERSKCKVERILDNLGLQVPLSLQIIGRLLLSEGEKTTLAEIAERLVRKALEELAAVAKPDTLLAWYRELIANKFDGSKFRQRVGRPRIYEEAERLVVQMAKENPSWRYNRIRGSG
jgi:putative transposase